MAKKSMIARERSGKLVQKYRCKACRAERDRQATRKANGRAFSRVPGLGETAAQQLGRAFAQPLPAHRSSARVLP